MHPGVANARDEKKCCKCSSRYKKIKKRKQMVLTINKYRWLMGYLIDQSDVSL